MLNEEDAHLKVEISTGQNAGFQFKSHPNIDKGLYTSENVLRLKDPQKPFPAGSPLGILKWRMQVTQSPHISLFVLSGSRCTGISRSLLCPLNMPLPTIAAKTKFEVQAGQQRLQEGFEQPFSAGSSHSNLKCHVQVSACNTLVPCEMEPFCAGSPLR